MTSAVPDLDSFRFSTSALPLRDRFAIFREVFGHRIVRMEFDAQDPQFHADIALRSLPGVGLVSAEHSPMRFGRSRQLLDDGDDRLAFSVSMVGGKVAQLGREATIEPGGAMLISSGDAFTFDSAAGGSPSRCIILMLSREKLRRSLGDFDAALIRGIAASTPALALLMSYIGIFQDTAALTPEMAQLGVSHIYDLVAVALGATRDATQLASKRGIPAARLHAIKTDILARPGQHKLSLDTLAVRHGISPVYVRKLFDSEGTSFSEFVLEQRLQLARRLLAERHQH